MKNREGFRRAPSQLSQNKTTNGKHLHTGHNILTQTIWKQYKSHQVVSIYEVILDNKSIGLRFTNKNIQLKISHIQPI